MDKTKALAAVNIVLFISAFLQVSSGLAAVLIGSHLAYRVHRLNGVFFPIVLIVHLKLNWGWVKAVVLERISVTRRARRS